MLLPRRNNNQQYRLILKVTFITCWFESQKPNVASPEDAHMEQWNANIYPEVIFIGANLMS